MELKGYGPLRDWRGKWQAVHLAEMMLEHRVGDMDLLFLPPKYDTKEESFSLIGITRTLSVGGYTE